MYGQRVATPGMERLNQNSAQIWIQVRGLTLVDQERYIFNLANYKDFLRLEAGLA